MYNWGDRRQVSEWVGEGPVVETARRGLMQDGSLWNDWNWYDRENKLNKCYDLTTALRNNTCKLECFSVNVTTY